MNTFQSIVLILTFLIMCAILVILIIASIKITSLFKPIPKCKYSLPEDVDLKKYLTADESFWSTNLADSGNDFDLKDSSGNKVGQIKLTLNTDNDLIGQFEGGLEDGIYSVFTHNQIGGVPAGGGMDTFNFSKLLMDESLRGIQSSLSSDGINKTPMAGIGTMFDATCEY